MRVGCLDGWLPYSESCYKVNMDEMSQSDARAECQSQGGELASIGDDSEVNFIISILYVLLFPRVISQQRKYPYFISHSYRIFACGVWG